MTTAVSAAVSQVLGPRLKSNEPCPQRNGPASQSARYPVPQLTEWQTKLPERAVWLAAMDTVRFKRYLLQWVRPMMGHSNPSRM